MQKKYYMENNSQDNNKPKFNINDIVIVEDLTFKQNKNFKYTAIIKIKNYIENHLIYDTFAESIYEVDTLFNNFILTLNPEDRLRSHYVDRFGRLATDIEKILFSSY